MSYRVCAKCDYVINNRFNQTNKCSECGSTEMLFPDDDPRDWNRLYKDQQEKMLAEIRKEIDKKCNKL